MHNFPHLNQDLEKVDNTFNITSNLEYNDYTESLIVLPSYIGASGVLLMFAFVLILAMRFCCQCARCRPKIIYEADAVNRASKKKRLAIISIFFLCLVILSDSSIIAGNVLVIVGVKSGLSSINSFSNTFESLTDDGIVLQDEGVILETELTSAVSSGCTEASYLTPYITDYNTAVDSYMKYVDNIPNKLDNIHSGIVKYGIQIKNAVVYTFFVVIILFLSFFIIGMCYNSVVPIKVGIASTWCLMLFLLLLCTVGMSVLVS
jgi:hypothetical protein